MELSDFLNRVGHVLSGLAIVGSWIGIFPYFASLVAVIFYVVQLYESKTIQTYLSARRLRQIARLKIEMARLEALELVAHPKNRVDILPARIAAAELIEEAKSEAADVIKAAVSAAAALKEKDDSAAIATAKDKKK